MFPSFEDFKQSILDELKHKNPQWRDGQFVFNYIDERYNNVARQVQFIDKVDCFYIDDNIDAFLEKVYARLQNNKYPYLGKKVVNGHTIVVMFCSEDYGFVVVSDNDELKIGTVGDFDESQFAVLDPEEKVTLSN